MFKLTLCPGPGAQIEEWKKSQKEYFGRGDKEYKNIKNSTIKWLKKISKKNEIIPIAGSATTAAYICFQNFLNKKILIIRTGYYSERWIKLVKKIKVGTKVVVCDYNNIEKIKSNFDWIIFVYVETSECRIYDIKKVYNLKKKVRAKLITDATASIGLENNHELTDILFFSSCKGLLGPTGLGFIGYNKNIKIKNKTNFFTDIKTHQNSLYTLGYNCMAALHLISKNHKSYVSKIKYARKILLKYSLNKKNPLIGLNINKIVKNKNKFKNVIFYQPRDKKSTQLVFFLGFVKFSKIKINKLIKKIFLK